MKICLIQKSSRHRLPFLLGENGVHSNLLHHHPFHQKCSAEQYKSLWGSGSTRGCSQVLLWLKPPSYYITTAMEVDCKKVLVVLTITMIWLVKRNLSLWPMAVQNKSCVEWYINRVGTTLVLPAYTRASHQGRDLCPIHKPREEKHMWRTWVEDLHSALWKFYHLHSAHGSQS